MRAHPPTILINVPALFQMLLASPTFRALDFGGLRLAVTAAAPFSADEKKKLEAVIGEGKITEVYGMTETGPVQTCNPAPRFKLGHVGIPVPGTDIRLVDVETGTKDVRARRARRDHRERPAGDAELPRRGGHEHALRELDGRTWMYTGDVGIMDDEGYIRICDRSKDMLIVGGYKVFSVEVENKLQALPFVALTAMVGRPDEARPGNEIAQLSCSASPAAPSPKPKRAKRSCASVARTRALQDPERDLLVDALPLTSVGKIDKGAAWATL